MAHDTRLHWYETPLWLVPQLVVYVVLWSVLNSTLSNDANEGVRWALSLGLLLLVGAGGIWIRGRLRRRDA